MVLDRQSIARRDFPTSRRGYEPAAVDRHLAAIADEVDELRRRAGPGAVLATQTSDQVRVILEAAESSAAGIRDAAGAEGREHVARVAQAADALRARIETVEAELTGLFATLREGAERLRADLDGAVADAARVVEAGPGSAAPEGVAPSALGATVGSVPAAADEEVGEEPALAAVEEAASAPPRRDDVAGARIVAYERALAGQPRDETERYVADTYAVSDAAALVDEAYELAKRR